MPRLEILEYPDPRLRLRSEPVTDFGEDLNQLVENLFDTLYATEAIGLSAPQVNVQREVLVMDLSGNASAPQVYINPQIVSSAAPGLVEESCLSVPGVAVNVIRATEIRVRSRRLDGETFLCDLSGMDAVCLAHEMDHLTGKLLVDRLSLLGRLRLRVRSNARQRASAKQAAA